MHKNIFIIHFIIISLIVSFFYGCENGPTVINYGDPSIFAELRKSERIGELLADVEVEGTRLIPVVVINDDTLALGACNPKGEYMWGSVFTDEVSIDPDNEYELIVSHNGGEASAAITLPGDFEITSPEEYGTLYTNENLTVNWSQSEGVERYELHISLGYSYGDTANPDFRRFYLDTLLSNTVTSLTVQGERIFPSEIEIDSIQEGNGSLYINAANGPQIGISSEGNISGEGIGYFTALCRRSMHFIIEDASN
jgi:hypothetical protein